MKAKIESVPPLRHHLPEGIGVQVELHLASQTHDQITKHDLVSIVEQTGRVCRNFSTVDIRAIYGVEINEVKVFEMFYDGGMSARYTQLTSVEQCQINVWRWTCLAVRAANDVTFNLWPV